MDLITVYRTFSIAEAQVVRSRLETAEFHPTVANDISSVSMDGYTMAAGGVLVQVPDTEAASARELIEASEHPAT